MALPRKLRSRAGLERPCHSLADLATMHQIVVGEHARHHGFPDRHGTNTDAWIVTPGSDDIGVVAIERSTVFRGVSIEEVGLTTKRVTISCPVEMPPRMPPA